LPKNDAEFAGLDSKVLAAPQADWMAMRRQIMPVNQRRWPAHSMKRRTVCACYGHPACGPNSAPPAPLGPFCLGQEQSVWAKKEMRREQSDGEDFGAGNQR
jgi:hypothetical protein